MLPHGAQLVPFGSSTTNTEQVHYEAGNEHQYKETHTEQPKVVTQNCRSHLRHIANDTGKSGTDITNGT